MVEEKDPTLGSGAVARRRRNLGSVPARQSVRGVNRCRRAHRHGNPYATALSRNARRYVRAFDAHGPRQAVA